MTQEPDPIAPPAADNPSGPALIQREEAASRAGLVQTLGILSIVFGICCPLVGICLGGVTLVLGSSATAAAQQLAAGDLLDKIATGKTCAVVGLAVAAVGWIAAGLAVMQALNG
jgi:hypothetical protein